MGNTTREHVTSHYARNGDMTARILEVLPEVEGDPAAPTYSAVHHFDQFHVGGPPSTRNLAERAGIKESAVLDLGCGIGGPARTLAAEYGCDVTGIDLTESFCRSAAELSRLVGLNQRTRFLCASVHNLPVPDGRFDWAWTQHAIMNIPDTPRMYREVARVLRPGGHFVHHDIVLGDKGEPTFPVPWASTPAGSFLQTPDTIYGQLCAAGLEPVLWEDITNSAIAGIKDARARREAGDPEPPGPHLVQGESFLKMRANLARNLLNGHVRVVRGIWRL